MVCSMNLVGDAGEKGGLGDNKNQSSLRGVQRRNGGRGGRRTIRKWDVSSSPNENAADPDNFKPVKKILDSTVPSPLLCLLHVAILSDRIY